MAIPFRLRLAKAILGSRAKDFIPALNPMDGTSFGTSGRINDYTTKQDQIRANIGWCFTANNAIADPTAAITLKLYRKASKGKDRVEILEHEILDLLDAPNLVHTGEQLRHLHFTYMNFVGESYIFMRDLNGEGYVPSKGRLPAALDIFPAHRVQFVLGTTYTNSVVRLGKDDYPIVSFIRDLNPDPENPYFGRSIIKASATTIDTDNQMKEWNRGIFANNARPSLIFKTNEPLSDESYNRWKEQFHDEHTGPDNAYKPLLIEGGDATPYMLNQQDLDFLESRKFSRDEILAMWRVNPYIIGSVENINLATAKASRMQHAEINLEPRIRQFVKQLNATLISVYDPTLELDFENPVPEDEVAKLNEAVASVDKWRTKDEVRAMYGEDPLPDGLGSEIVVLGKGAISLEDVLNGEVASASDTSTTTDDGDGKDPENMADDKTDPKDTAKSLTGVKKNN